MDKETEIKHLRALQQGDTYFAMFFKDDIDTMVQNITNDFPIELGCKFVAKADALKSSLATLQKNCEEAKFNIAVTMYKELGEDVPAALQEMILGYLGSPLRVIEAKTAANVPPTKEEVEYLIRQAKRD